MTAGGVVDGGYLLDVSFLQAGYDALQLSNGARVTDLHSDATIDVEVSGDEVTVTGAQAATWFVDGTRGRFTDCSGAWFVSGERNSIVNSRAGVPDFAYTGPVLELDGDRNRWLGGLIEIDAPAGSPAVIIAGGDANTVADTDVGGGPSGDYSLEVTGGTRARIDNVRFDPAAVPVAGRINAADGTCEASETKEWGFGGVVVTGASVILTAWRDLSLYRVVVTLGAAGSGDTVGDILVNGVTVATFTVPAAATTATEHVNVDLDPGDLVAVDITTAGPSAQDITVQAELLR